MARENSPSSVMYADLKTLGLSNRDVAMTLLDPDRSFGEGTLFDRIDSRTRLSRDIVHVEPGALSRTLFRSFDQSTQALMGSVMARAKRERSGGAAEYLLQHFNGPAAQDMQQALREYHLDDNVYRNTLAQIAGLRQASTSEQALLSMMLFVVTGCTGNALEGAKEVERFSAERVGTAFRTVEAHVDLDYDQNEAEEEENYALGLMRIVGGKLKGANAFYRLSATEQGTEIGTMPAGDGGIADVDEDVSRRHARIYCSHGHWYLVGLKSTNGTSVISGADKQVYVVEPPKRDRPRTWTPEPYEIFPTDTICLGATTRFMVMPVLG